MRRQTRVVTGSCSLESRFGMHESESVTSRSGILDACLAAYTEAVSAPAKTFYIETFGCQMNAHDSEKVIGTLEHEGYTRVEEEEAAGLILYNTCSIRDKAEQKVFHRLNEYKRMQGEGKQFAVLGCVAQQEGEKIFERAPYVSLVSGSASYRNLPEMLVRLEAGEKRITGSRRSPHAGRDLRHRVHHTLESAPRLHHHH